jgi:hypothetical protein
MKTAGFGSILHGTMRPEDLIPEFAWELRHLRGRLPRQIANDVRRFEAGKLDEDHADFLLSTLSDMLDEHAPQYGYFGAHPGDGSDYGFWLHEDWQQCARDDGVLEVDDLSKVPKGYRGQVLHINDHGNATLYYTTTRGLREIWSVV